MYLSEAELKAKVNKKEIIVEPALENMYGPASIYLRLGTQFMYSWTDSSKDKIFDHRDSISAFLSKNYETVNATPEQPFTMIGKSHVLCTTLELIQIPNNLIGFAYPRASFQRMGMQIDSGILSPGFSGRVTLGIHNFSNYSIVLYPGMKITEIIFAQIGLTHLQSQPTTHSNNSDTPETDQDIRELGLIIKKDEQALQNKDFDIQTYRKILSETQENVSEKGKILEELARYIFENIVGIKIIKVNARLKAEEIDLLLQNNISSGFWRFAGSPIVVECKNWTEKVGSSEISILADKMAAISPNVKTGILICPNGITGSSYRDAILKIREKRQHGKEIIVVDRASLEKVANGKSIIQVFDECYNNMLLI